MIHLQLEVKSGNDSKISFLIILGKLIESILFSNFLKILPYHYIFIDLYIIFIFEYICIDFQHFGKGIHKNSSKEQALLYASKTDFSIFLNYSFLVFPEALTQRRIQKPIKYLRWTVLRK